MSGVYLTIVGCMVRVSPELHASGGGNMERSQTFRLENSEGRGISTATVMFFVPHSSGNG